MKILILFAHPAFQKSHVNRQLVSGLDSIEGVTFRDLYELYPEYDINIKLEQEILMDHDCIIFHHPMYWYNIPSILKEWMDLVLQHGWAYGKVGTALQGKYFFNALTTGGPIQAFQKSGMHSHTVQELLIPIILTAQRCGMINLPPFVVHGTHAMEPDDIEVFKNDYQQLLISIVEDRFDPDQARELEYLNDYLIKEEL
jgi:glutathione-regulated potassium-efflux system ancillary protein KefG